MALSKEQLRTLSPEQLKELAAGLSQQQKPSGGGRLGSTLRGAARGFQGLAPEAPQKAVAPTPVEEQDVFVLDEDTNELNNIGKVPKGAKIIRQKSVKGKPFLPKAEAIAGGGKLRTAALVDGQPVPIRPTSEIGENISDITIAELINRTMRGDIDALNELQTVTEEELTKEGLTKESVDLVIADADRERSPFKQPVEGRDTSFLENITGRGLNANEKTVMSNIKNQQDLDKLTSNREFFESKGVDIEKILKLFEG